MAEVRFWLKAVCCDLLDQTMSVQSNSEYYRLFSSERMLKADLPLRKDIKK